MTPSNADLRQFILQFFNDEELETLCFDYFPEVQQNFTGEMTKNRKALLLIGFCDTRGRLPDLYGALARERETAWNRAFNAPPYVEWLKSLPDKVFPPTITQAPPPSPPPRERYVKEEQWRQLQALAHVIAAELGRQSGDDELRKVYRRFNRHFELTTYKKLPRRRFDEGLAFLTAWQAEMVPAWLPPGHRLLAADRLLHEKTNIELIRIPAGPFLYGSADSDDLASDNEKPQRTVYLPEYWIGLSPVTNRQYKRFLDDNPGHRVPFINVNWAIPHNWDEKRRLYPPNKADHPVVLVSWHDSQAFCNWAGLALPTEAQWEKAARGTDGRIWPWGNEPPTVEHCNFNRNIGDTTPVGKYSTTGSSFYGCVDMAGNVWDWTVSWIKEGESLTLRGGSWGSNQKGLRAARREKKSGPYSLGNHIGFRVVELLSDPGS